MTVLNVITPLSRPENIAAMAASLCSGIEIRWHVSIDPVKAQRLTLHDLNSLTGVPANVEDVILTYPGGYSVTGAIQRTFALATIDRDEWVAFLDDDNTFPPGFLDSIAPILETDLDGFTVSQADKNGRMRLPATLAPVIGRIDTAQIFIRRYAALNDWPNHYCGDGEFAKMVFSQSGFKFAAYPELFVSYNKLR